MILNSSDLLRLAHTITFPAEVWHAQHAVTAMTITRPQYDAMVAARTLIGIGHRNRIRHLRLIVPIQTLAGFDKVTQGIPTAADNRTIYMDGVTFRHHKGRSQAYGYLVDNPLPGQRGNVSAREAIRLVRSDFARFTSASSITLLNAPHLVGHQRVADVWLWR